MRGPQHPRDENQTSRAWPVLAGLLASGLFLSALLSGLQWVGETTPGFFVGPHAIIHPVGGIDWPERGDLLFNARLVAVDGEPIASGDAVYRTIEQRPPGTLFRYTLRQGDTLIELTVPSRTFSLSDFAAVWGALLFFGAFCFGAGVLVFTLRPESRQARVFCLESLVAGTYATAAVLLHQSAPPIVADLAILANCFFPATFIHLAMVFPVEHRARWIRRGVIPGAYAVSGVLAVVVLRDFLDPLRSLPSLAWSYVWIAFGILVFVGTLVVTWKRNPDPMARGRIRVLLPGLALGTGAAFYVFVANALGAGLPVQFALVAPVLFFASIGYSVTRQDLFEIDHFVRQGLVYAGLSALVVIAYSLAVAGLPRLLPGFRGPAREVVGTLAAIAAALGFEPLRKRVQFWLDRSFYRQDLDYRSTVGEVTRALATILDAREVADRVTAALTGSMQLESVAILRAGGEDSGAELALRRAGGELEMLVLPDAAVPETESGTSEGGDLLSALPEDVRRQIESAHLRDPTGLQLPLVFGGIREGVLAVGPRRSRTPFSVADEELLQTLASQTAISLRNARSYEALQKLNRELDDKVRARTAELQNAYSELEEKEEELVQSEKMASLGQLVAGVAHELNNPASFVIGSIENLDEMFAVLRRALESGSDEESAATTPPVDPEDLEDALFETPRVLRICAEGAERIQKIVEQLKLFVRKDRGETIVHDLSSDLRTTLALLDSRIRSDGIEVDLDLSTVAAFEGDPTQLNQVWMNLLTNAVDAVRESERKTIRVTLRPSDDGRVEVEIADSGSGMPPEIRDKIFDPFYTTKPVGSGTGLGLSLAFSAVRNHQGSIDVETRPGGGSTFRVRLPCTAPD